MKRIFSLLLIVLFCLSLASCGVKYDKFISDANEAYANENFDKAIELCNEAIEVDAQKEDAYEIRAEAYLTKLDFEKAISDYKHIAEKEGGEKYKFRLAEIFIEVERYEEAVTCLDEYIAKYSTDADAYLMLVDVLIMCGDVPRANEVKTHGYKTTGDDRLYTNVMSREEAATEGGMYVMQGDFFYPLIKTGRFAFSQTGTSEKLEFITVDDGALPIASSGTSLVYFSEKNIQEHCAVLPVRSTGYTMPLNFYEDGRIKWRAISFNDERKYYYGQHLETVFDAYDKALGYSITPEKINGQAYTAFFNEKVNKANEIVSLEEGESVEIEYHAGTEFRKVNIPANLIYFSFAPKDEKMIRMQLSNEPYAILDISNLSEGMYVISPTGRAGGERYVLNVV